MLLLKEASVAPYLFNLFLNDLNVTQYCQASDLTKYSDDTSIFVTVRKNSVDETKKGTECIFRVDRA